jgi:hypothetical protein
MKKVILCILVLSLHACTSQSAPSKHDKVSSPPFVYKNFGFAPNDWKGNELSSKHIQELDECKAVATNQQKGSSTNNKLDALYGFKLSTVDLYGTTLTGCLADEKDGKGWFVYARTPDSWNKVSSRYAARTFLGIDPSQ